MTPYSLFPLAHCIRVYSILIQTGMGGGELTREKVRRAIDTKPVENTNMTDCISNI